MYNSLTWYLMLQILIYIRSPALKLFFKVRFDPFKSVLESPLLFHTPSHLNCMAQQCPYGPLKLTSLIQPAQNPIITQNLLQTEKCLEFSFLNNFCVVWLIIVLTLQRMLSVLTNYSSRSFFTKLTLVLIFAFINSFRFLLIYLVTYDLLLGGVLWGL